MSGVANVRTPLLDCLSGSAARRRPASGQGGGGTAPPGGVPPARSPPAGEGQGRALRLVHSTCFTTDRTAAPGGGEHRGQGEGAGQINYAGWLLDTVSRTKAPGWLTSEKPPPTPCRCLRRPAESEERFPARGSPSPGGAVSAPAVSDTRAECKTTLRSRPPPPPPGIILGQITRDISRQADPPLRLRQAAVKIGFAEVAQPPGERSGGAGGGVKRGAGPRRSGMARGVREAAKKEKERAGKAASLEGERRWSRPAPTVHTCTTAGVLCHRVVLPLTGCWTRIPLRGPAQIRPKLPLQVATSPSYSKPEDVARAALAQTPNYRDPPTPTLNHPIEE
ncbi:uncharacterized protein LOC126282451 [Schistocerca gregaria]|uniref:uncharacterized protein LOC126282451 n=1 Tax=Schistocerca gregaria TaxID=7010 RepID=UPI00211E7B37|nr:uncharacterized protein LOC126282451 [Schistocerca gregaria]